VYGYLAALLALLLYASDPNIIAHSSVVTTDLGATVAFLATVYCLWRFCQKPSWTRLLLTGIVFGLAQATKFSALFLAPICLIILGIWISRQSSPTLPLSLPLAQRLSAHPRLQRAYHVFLLCVIIFLVGAVVLWGVYGLKVSPLLPHEESHPLLDRLLPTSHPLIRRLAYSLAEHFPVPAPAYFADLAWLQRYARSGHASFLAGSYGRSGWWFYFPVAFLIKTPVPVLILLLAAAYHSWRVKSPAHDAYFLVVPAMLFFVSSMLSSIDIGYRNILPVLPFLFIYVSQIATRVVGRVARAALVVLCAWCLLGTLLLSPHYLAYFNELVGGPTNGYRYLVDSNLDWGQDLKHLKRYLDSRAISEVYLSYFGTADPGYYGIDFLPMPEKPPAAAAEPAYYVISATSLQGVYAGGANRAHWLAQYEPGDRVGYSMFVYRLP
jgi:4-amino-4-deoxy-L-arabinose transferase-like glycosyltransferase